MTIISMAIFIHPMDPSKPNSNANLCKAFSYTPTWKYCFLFWMPIISLIRLYFSLYYAYLCSFLASYLIPWGLFHL